MPSSQQSLNHPDQGGVRILAADAGQAAAVLEATQQFLSDLGLRAAARCDLLKDCLLYTSRCV